MGGAIAQRYVIYPGILVQHELVRADLAVDGHAVCLGFLNLRDRFLARDMNDVNWAACDPGIIKIGPRVSRFGECGERSSQAPMSVRPVAIRRSWRTRAISQFSQCSNAMAGAPSLATA